MSYLIARQYLQEHEFVFVKPVIFFSNNLQLYHIFIKRVQIKNVYFVIDKKFYWIIVFIGIDFFGICHQWHFERYPHFKHTSLRNLSQRQPKLNVKSNNNI